MTETIAKNPEIAARAASRKFYQLIIRWHFFCGLLFIPLIIVISISGCIYLFEDEYEDFMYQDLLFISPGEKALLASTLLAKARLAVPDMRAASFKSFPQADKSTEIIFKEKSKHMHHKTKPVKTSME